MSDALDDQLDRLNPFDISYNDFVRLKPQVKAALQDLFYTEVLELIGEDYVTTTFGLNPEMLKAGNAVKAELRAKAAAKWGKA